MTERLCITMGDPTGIGPEITARFLANRPRPHAEYVVVGHHTRLQAVAEAMGLTLPTEEHGVHYVPIYGRIEKEPGSISYMALEKAVELLRHNQVDALVTGPISKENLYKDGLRFGGHTEILAHLSRHYFDWSGEVDMLFVYRHFRMLLLTRHIPLSEVSQALTIPGVYHSLENLVHFLKTQAGVRNPRLCLIGVNPHAGEIGGTEENQVLIPVAHQLTSTHGILVDGPFPADALFRGFTMTSTRYDAYIAPYHDIGLVPFKMIAGYKAVNVTIGLPFIRTSVGHGVAMDLVDLHQADPSGLYEAVAVAGQLLAHRTMVYERPTAAKPI